MQKGKFTQFPTGTIQTKAAAGQWDGRVLTGVFKGDEIAREIKTIPAHVKVVGERTVEGVFSIFGNVDTTIDRLHPGCMTKTIAENFRRIVHVWMHDWSSPPIAVVDSVRELRSDELPPEVKEWAPDATGGGLVTRTYLSGQVANEVFEGISKGAIKEMSFAFDTIKWGYTEDEQYPWPIREVTELRLWETSDVIWGANDATIGDMRADDSSDRLQKGIEDGTITTDTVLRVFESLKAGTLDLKGFDAKDWPVLLAVANAIVEIDTGSKNQADDSSADKPDAAISLDDAPSLELLDMRLRVAQLD